MEISKMSAQQVGTVGLRGNILVPDASHEQIGRLRDRAMSSPETRARIISRLEQYEQRYRGTSLATAAGSAVSTILAVAMLEMLQEE